MFSNQHADARRRNTSPFCEHRQTKIGTERKVEGSVLRQTFLTDKHNPNGKWKFARKMRLSFAKWVIVGNSPFCFGLT